MNLDGPVERHRAPTGRGHPYVVRVAGAVLVAAAVTALSSCLPAASTRVMTAGPAEAVAVPVEGDYIAPQWSPVGSRLAFAGSRYTGIYVLDAETGDLQTVTEEPASGFGFSWSPDGSAILARVARFDGPRRTDAVKIFHLDTGETEVLTDYRNDLSAMPHWTPSGRVYLYADGEIKLNTSVDGTARSRSDDDGHWFATDQGLARIDLSSGTVEPHSEFGDRGVLNVAASPEGSRIAFELLDGRVYTMHADGTNVVEIGAGNRPSWSPDGSWIVYSQTRDDGHTITHADLHAARADGSERVQLTDTPEKLEMNPSWSPDGLRVAYDDHTDGGIYVLPLER